MIFTQANWNLCLLCLRQTGYRNCRIVYNFVNSMGPHSMPDSHQPAKATYRAAGVDINAGNAIIAPFKAIAEASMRREILAGVGSGFAAQSRIPQNYRQPIIVAGTDGVGSKLKLAIQQNRHESLGQDLVAMSVNDVLVCGAEPLMFLDYFATSRFEPEIAIRLVQGITDACCLAGCTLAGGETAEMPGLYTAGDYDLAGFCVGIVEEDEIIKGAHITAGDVLLGIHSSGPHANGFSLIRMLLKTQSINLGKEPKIARQLLEPTRIYVDAVQAITRAVQVKGIAHITGGGLTDNLPRMLPDELAIEVDQASWHFPEIFRWLQALGTIETAEMLRTFNCGIGMVFCLAENQLSEAERALEAAGETSVVIGRIVPKAADQPPLAYR